MRPFVKYYDKMHYEEVLDMFCSCIRANISMIHKTIYQISSTLLFRTHFKPPSSVCNNFLLRSHVEFGNLLLLKYAIYSLLHRCTNYHFRCTHSSQENHIQTIFYRNRVFIILYNLQLLLSCLFLLFCFSFCAVWWQEVGVKPYNAINLQQLTRYNF